MIPTKHTTVSHHIRQVMQEEGLTQKAMASLLGISQPAISQYLQGRLPPAPVLYAIARVGNTSIEWLLTGIDADQLPARVAEGNVAYGSEGMVLQLWRQLPESIRQSLLVLIRDIARANTGVASKNG